MQGAEVETILQSPVCFHIPSVITCRTSFVPEDLVTYPLWAERRPFALWEGDKMKYLANLISLARILLSFLLLLTGPLTLPFYFIYGLCGVSDMLDGYLARKYNCASRMGALLDSLADAVMVFLLLFLLVPLLHWPLWALWWTEAVLLIRALSLAAGLVRFRTLAFLHTYLNKAAGFVLFFFPFFFGLLPDGCAISIVCGAAAISGAEELLINQTAEKLNRNIRGFWDSKQGGTAI